MQTTVRICGVEYADCERVQDGEFCGIKTLGKTFWLFPVCDENGGEIQSLPPYLPCVIRAVTVESPDLTKQFPKTVQKIFEKRRDYFAKTTTLDCYLKDNPPLPEPPTEEQFQNDRNRIMSEPLKDFKRDAPCKYQFLLV